MQNINVAAGLIPCCLVRTFSTAVVSADKRPEERDRERERWRHGALPLLVSVREAGRERVLERCGGGG